MRKLLILMNRVFCFSFFLLTDMYLTKNLNQLKTTSRPTPVWGQCISVTGREWENRYIHAATEDLPPSKSGITAESCTEAQPHCTLRDYFWPADWFVLFCTAPFELPRLKGRAKCNILIKLEGYSFLKFFPLCTWNSLYQNMDKHTALNFADPICSAWMVTEHSLKWILLSFLQPCDLQLGSTLKNSPEIDFLTFIQIQTLKTFKDFFILQFKL